MKLLISHICYLLGEHRIVPVPGLGTFMRVDKPAVIEDGMLVAPHSDIEFSEDVDSHAGRILEYSIARALTIPAKDAQVLIESEVEELRKHLYSGENVTLDGVGVLALNSGHIGLVQDKQMGWSALSWYTSLPVAPLKAEQEAQKNVPDPAVREAFMRSLSRTASSAAAIAVLILIAFITSQLPGRRGASEPTYASFGVETTAVAPTDALIPRPGNLNKALLLVLNTPEDGIIESSEAVPSQVIPDDPFVLVVASLANQGEVDRYLHQHSGEKLELLNVGGRYRVYAATGQSVVALQAQAGADGLYDKYPNAWICRR